MYDAPFSVLSYCRASFIVEEAAKVDRIHPEVMRVFGFQDVMVDTPVKWHGDFKNNNVGPGGQYDGVGRNSQGVKYTYLKKKIT